ncbi:MAG TPA: hypothetical protein VM307_05650 [Egibacteraceae bacterium]|nr:hypothetical protein [Egibacteraceae bacterium]
MGKVVPLPRRELFVDARGSALRASWHEDRGVAVVSLWHDDQCVGSVRLSPQEAGRLAKFLLGHLAALAETAVTPADPAASG